jgi:hypothetical protein
VRTARLLATGVPVLQLRRDIFVRSRPLLETDQAMILFGVIGRALRLIHAHTGSDQAVRHRWSEAIGADCARVEEIASLLLRDALRENDGGPVLFSSIHAERIETAAAAAEKAVGPDPALDRFRTFVADELLAPEVHP